ncbi:hypothetical protein [Mycobacterium sp. 94-17]|uniref:hypothetical protein n=1 Tax=Mycobacterium sp. 94-17 TaxID=2986147 RepID=UPI002D1E8808|nr:hypothetical protein [Mycobacterium sp. 94-17]MEB4212286.1 hypothetical protein [Mycobacterium sp. 94-17]
MTPRANTVVEHFLIPLVTAKKIALVTWMIRASRTDLSRGDRFCHPAISPVCRRPRDIDVAAPAPPMPERHEK